MFSPVPSLASVFDGVHIESCLILLLEVNGALAVGHGGTHV